jgi:2-phospho-L-lactate guanylyltransferase
MKDVWAVVPIKGVADAKQRLASVLVPEARRELAFAMAQTVLAALAQSPSLAGIVVVTADEQVASLALRVGARIHGDNATSGHSAAVMSGAALLARERRRTMLSLPGDLPLLAASDVERVIQEHDTSPQFIVVPARDLAGSNAVLCSPPNVVPLQFGEDSFRRHLALARAAGLAPSVIRVPGIELDVDSPADLAEWRRHASIDSVRS